MVGKRTSFFPVWENKLKPKARQGNWDYNFSWVSLYFSVFYFTSIIYLCWAWLHQSRQIVLPNNFAISARIHLYATGIHWARKPIATWATALFPLVIVAEINVCKAASIALLVWKSDMTWVFNNDDNNQLWWAIWILLLTDIALSVIDLGRKANYAIQKCPQNHFVYLWYDSMW